MLPITIRPEQPGDYNAILRLTYEAFLTLEYPGRQRVDEHFFIHLLRGSASVISALSFVAVFSGEIVGHIVYTNSKVVRGDGTEKAAITFGPLSVSPRYHRQGIGAALVAHSMEKAKAMGFGAVLIIGVPEYYPKLGFLRARKFGLTLENETDSDAFMAYELVPGYLHYGGKAIFLAPEVEQCEVDAAGFSAFHAQFMRDYI